LTVKIEIEKFNVAYQQIGKAYTDSLEKYVTVKKTAEAGVERELNNKIATINYLTEHNMKIKQEFDTIKETEK
jgi:hypothetical protein